MTKPVFISYARKESTAAARALSKALGPDIAFFDERHLEDGEELPTGIADALLGARVIVVFATNSYFESWYCRRELRICLTAYDALVASGADPHLRDDALRHVVIALPAASGSEVLDQLPPELRRRLWPTPDAIRRLVSVVRRRLEMLSVPLGDHMEAQGLRAAVEAFVEQAGMPAPRSLAGVPVWGPPGEPQPSLGDGFIGRADELWKIHDILQSRGAKMAGLTGSVEGGAGFGKTRLATEYLHRFGPTFYPGGLFWVRADLDLVAQFHGILSCLDSTTPDLKTFTDAGRDAWKEVGDALDKRATDKAILYVVDNVPEPAPGTKPQPLSTWCPALGRVALLATSRATQSLTGSVTSLQVDVLRSTHAVTLLTRDYGERHHLSIRHWERIAEWVGNLPLALEILNASLLAGALTPNELLAMVTAPPVAEVDQVAEALTALVPVGALRGIGEILMISYERLDPNAQEAARLLARLGSFPIPLEILEALGSDLSSLRVRATLGTRSLLTVVSGLDEGVTFLGRMHPLLADFLRARAEDPDADRLRACWALIKVMEPGRCSDPRFWSLMNACAPHAEELFWAASRARQPKPLRPVVILGLAIGFLFSAKGLAHRAAEVDKEALQLAVESEEMGPEDPNTLTVMNNLAITLRAQGDLAGARDLQHRVLNAMRRVRGDEHIETLRVMNNLSETLRAQGDLPAARDLQERVLDARLRLLGNAHPDTLMAMHGLAGILEAQGHLPAARKLQHQVLNAARRLLGDDHLDTLTAMSNLANILRGQGDLLAAKDLQREVLDARRRLLGDDHPSTLKAMSNLARTLYDQGNLLAARELAEEVLNARPRLLGDEHPDTLTAMNNLATVLHDQGNFPAARELGEQVLDTRRRLFGDEHPDTLTAMNNLATVLHDQGDFLAARELVGQVLDARRRLLGDEHPDTLTTMNNLAVMLHDQGDLRAARDLQGRVLSARTRTLGPEHPATTMSAWNLYTVLVEIDDEPAARAVLLDSLSWLLDRDPMQLTTGQRRVASLVGEGLNGSVDSRRRSKRRRLTRRAPHPEV